MTTDNTGSSGAADDLAAFEAEATGQAVDKPTTIPDKFKGKSVEDMIHIAMNAEKLISRQGAELGQVRRMADEILQLKKPTTETKAEVRQPVTVESLLNDPEKALNSAVNSSEIAQRATRAEQRVDHLERKLSETAFVSKHASFVDDMQDPNFISWVQKNPVRKTLGEAAAANNFEAAANLWDMWDEHKSLTGTTKTEAKQQSGKTVPVTVKSSPAESMRSGKPILSRSKLMELRLKAASGDQAANARLYDPAFQARLNEAYAEGRVK